ncbi:MAG: hypothetical protein J5J06_05290 [Phycisphaerae bacterium]|nr:hypothetical protein [Phycisphaerae bacterium]
MIQVNGTLPGFSTGCKKMVSAASILLTTVVLINGAFAQAPAGHGKSEANSADKDKSKDRESADKPETLKLDGLTLTVPAGWKSKPVAGNRPMGPVALYEIPHVEGDQSDPEVRITHFPNMKGMDDANIARWVRQVRQPNGQPSTVSDAKIQEETLGMVRLKVVELNGSVASSMGGSPNDPHGGLPNQRMIVAIIDHPKGPHFVRIVGDQATMAKWEPKIQEFLHSAKVTDSNS